MAGGTRWQQDTQNMFSAFGNLSDVIRREREKAQHDAIAKEMAERLYPGENIKTRPQLDMRMKVDQAMQDREYRSAMTERARREPQTRAGIGEDGLTPYQRIQADLARQREERLASKTREEAGDTPEKLEADLRKQFGITFKDVEEIMRKGATPSETDPNILTFSTRAGVPMTVERDKLMPFVNRGLSLYQSAQGGGSTPAANAIAQQPQSQVAPKTTTLTIPPDKAAEADAIRAAFKAGQITREEAKAKLAALAGLL